MPRLCRMGHLCVQLASDKLLDLTGGPDVCRLDLGQAGEGPAQLAAHKVGVAVGSGTALLRGHLIWTCKPTSTPLSKAPRSTE